MYGLLAFGSRPSTLKDKKLSLIFKKFIKVIKDSVKDTSWTKAGKTSIIQP